MKTEIKKTINEILINVFKNSSDLPTDFVELFLSYDEILQHFVIEYNTNDLSLKFKFSIDFKTVDSIIPNKRILNPGKRGTFTEVLNDDINMFIEFTQWVGAFNGDKDDCEKIAHFIEKNWSKIIAKQYGINK
jgi:hypothetical protein